MPDPARTTVSLLKDAVPLALNEAPWPNELRQPELAPVGALLPHGHAVPEPSPLQNEVPTVLVGVIDSTDIASSRMLGKFGSLVHTHFNPIHVAPPLSSVC